jgi:hypothetical protein
MVMKKAMLPFLKSDAEKGAARADAAKQQVRAAKASLKRARKLFKAAKKSAKQARKKLEAAAAARPPRKPSRRKQVPPGKPAVKAPAVKAPAVKASKKAPRKAAVSRKPRRARKGRAPPATDHLRSASDVAKSVIERLRSAPPTLPPAPVIPADPDTSNESPEVKPS